MNQPICRCFWVNPNNPRYVAYHDAEWGVPVHDDRKLFEMLLLESFQAGLSWECVLNKRDAFREAFDGFDPERISRYDNAKCAALLEAPIIRNRQKIRASVTNSRVFLAIRAEFGSFDAYIWGFVHGKPIRESCEQRTTSPLSDAISQDLRQRGMQFVGSTIIYAYLQAIGIYQAHTDACDWSRQE